jgi:ubiquinone/menaquinone biosynthesis C-methylase UbiE
MVRTRKIIALGPVTLLVVLLLGVPAGVGAAEHRAPQRTAEEWARIYNDSSRDAWQKPDEVLKALELKPGEVVADIGTGAGYFAHRFAQHVAKVYAVDIDEGLLRITARNAPANVETVLAAPDDPKLADDSVDTVFFCDVVHHIENRVAYYRRLAQVLRPGGRIVVIDFQKRPLPVGPPVHMKLAPHQVTREFEQAGFRLARQFDFLPHQYFLVFQR